jgi:alcohol dehydrogenase
MMTRSGVFVGEFQFPRLERVISGPNTVDTASAELDRQRITRALIVTGKTLGSSALLERITRPLGDRCAAVFTGARQHVPSSTVAQLIDLIERHEVDGIISFGGGSPIDTVKAAIHALLTVSGLSKDAIPRHVAVPTTLSAGEYTSVAGVTDERTRIKRALRDPGIAPRVVISDPTLTLATPPWLWAASGIRALDHAVESMYSLRHHPLSDALASRGLALLLAHLPPSLTTGGEEQLMHRSQCQMAAWMSVFGMTNAGFGLSHALGHQIGPRWDVPHGVTSCITLPHAMRFMADRVPERFRPIAEGFGLQFDEADERTTAMACADRMASFIAQFDVPRRLRDAKVPSEEIGDVAGIVHGIMDSAHVVDGAVTRGQLESLLAGAL